MGGGHHDLSFLTELERKAAAIADVLNYTLEIALAQDNMAAMERIAQNSVTIPDIHKIVIASLDQQILSSSDPFETGQQVRDPALNAFLNTATAERQSLMTEAGELMLIQPLRGGSFSASAGGDVVGAVQIVIKTAGAEAAARRVAFQFIGISLAGFVLRSRRPYSRASSVTEPARSSST